MSELNGDGEFTDMLINDSIRKIEHSIGLRSKQTKEGECLDSDGYKIVPLIVLVGRCLYMRFVLSFYFNIN